MHISSDPHYPGANYSHSNTDTCNAIDDNDDDVYW